MDRFRYILGTATIITIPSGILFWFLIHPFARRWRAIGAGRTYLVVVSASVTLGWLVFRTRQLLLGADLGTNWALIGIACLLLAAMVPLELQYWKQLSIRTLVGIPEVSRVEQPQSLLCDGAYRIVRHPRYLSAGLGIIANVLIANYTGVYLLVLVTFPLGYGMLLLEERELVGRFGEAYRSYQREVPRLIPKLRRRRP
jgi:protein-S-isoprenylcysteine O-methyltransferase Ste14